MTRKNRLLTNRAISLLLCLLMLLLCIPVSAVAEGSLGRVEETTTAEPDVPPFTTPQEDPPLTPTTPSLGTATPQPPIGDFRVPEKPSFIDETATRSVPLVTDLPDGNYHMRNLRTGWLLNAPVSTGSYARPVDMGFHTTNLGDEWIFEWQQGDTYIIRSRLYPDYALVDGGSVSLELIPEDGYWDMHHWYIYNYGGYYYIQSYLNQQYLCHDGENFFMSDTVPQGSSTNYLWDLIDTDDYTPLIGFTIDNSYWIAENTAEYVDLTITPSYADWAEYDEIGYNDFVWTSSNQNVAFVSGGIIFAYDAGYAILTAQHRATGLTESFTVTVGQAVAEGMYYFKNVKSEKFMDVEGPSSAEGARIQQWAFNGSTQSKWNIDYLENGLYTIQSVYSNKYIGVQSSNLDVYIKQYTSVTDATKWQIVNTEDGNFMLIPLLWKSDARVVQVWSNEEYDGIDLLHYYYVADDDYKDEWIIEKAIYGAQLYRQVDSAEINCHGYAMLRDDAPEDWALQMEEYVHTLTLDQLDSDLVNQTLSMKAKSDFENWLEEEGYVFEYEVEFSDNGDYRILASNQYRVVLRVGLYCLAFCNDQHCMYTIRSDYHFWYQTYNGQWANKHGQQPSELLPVGTTPFTEGTSGWMVEDMNLYDGNIYCYIITIE